MCSLFNISLTYLLTHFLSLSLKGKSLLKATTLAVIFPHVVYKQMEKNALAKKVNNQAAMSSDLQLFSEKVKMWLGKNHLNLFLLFSIESPKIIIVI